MRQVVHQLVQLVRASGRASRERPERHDAGNADRRADRIGGQCRKIAVGDLRARLVHRPRRQADRVAERNRPIDVVERRRRAGRVDAACASSVARRHVVLGEPHADLIAAARLMIDLHEDVRAVHRIRVHPGRDRGSGIPDRGQPRVDRGDVRVRDGHEARLRQLPLLDVAEDECPVALNRTAETCAVLLLVHRQCRSEVAVDIGMHHVRAALRHDVDVPAERASQLRLSA